MFKAFIDRESNIFRVLNQFQKKKLKFILVGGYAVSAFKHRFSVDADIVVQDKSMPKFREVLKKVNFVKKDFRELESEYEGWFESYTTKTEFPVTVDLMVNALTSRDTDASWSFSYFWKNSITKEITGIEDKALVRIPEKELQIAVKMHAARFTDIRDIVALCSGIDFDKTVKHVLRGDTTVLRTNLLKIRRDIRKDNFISSFKGVFALEKTPMTNFTDTKKLVDLILKEIKK